MSDYCTAVTAGGTFKPDASFDCTSNDMILVVSGTFKMIHIKSSTVMRHRLAITFCK